MGKRTALHSSTLKRMANDVVHGTHKSDNRAGKSVLNNLDNLKGNQKRYLLECITAQMSKHVTGNKLRAHFRAERRNKSQNVTNQVKIASIVEESELSKYWAAIAESIRAA